MNPVDTHISEKQEGDHTQEEPRPTQRRITDIVVQFAVSSNFSEKQGHCGNADPGKRGHRIFDLPLNLILRRKIIKYTCQITA